MTRAFTQTPKESPMSLSPDQVTTIRDAVDALRTAGRSGLATTLETLIPVKPVTSAGEALAVLHSALASQAQKDAAVFFVAALERTCVQAQADVNMLKRDVESLTADLQRSRRELADARNARPALRVESLTDASVQTQITADLTARSGTVIDKKA